MWQYVSKLFPILCIILAGCNSDNDISLTAPRITLSDPAGVYTVKVGRQLVIEPEFENLTPDAKISWTEDGSIIASGPVLRKTWNQPGEHYITVSVTTDAGHAAAQLRVEAVELAVPYISLPFSGSSVSVLTGTTFTVMPEVAGTDEPGFKITWTVDGTPAGSELTFTYKSDAPGTHNVEVKTENADGRHSRSFTLVVADNLPSSVRFPAQSFLSTSTKRFTFPGRELQLSPLTEGLEGKQFSWSVNGDDANCNTSVFRFKPTTPGIYTVSVTVDGRASASVEVECVNQSETSLLRAKNGSSKKEFNKIYEWIPAPGQFIGCTTAGGMTGNETTHQLALEWAKKRMDAGNYVSLGAFGGYIIVGFDHSIVASGGTNHFSIGGNAFAHSGSSADGSNEPGIVYVSQDVNGNGLPDDEWYELKGSDTFLASTARNYSVTYYRPAGPGMNVMWTDSRGASGVVDYLKALHRQEYYYPAWINAPSYTLSGTCLAPRTSQNPATGYWNNNAFGWGYADNVGSDNITQGAAGSGLGQAVGFKIDNAVYPDGSPVKLQYIDFIKVQTGVNVKAGGLGEVSTEVVGFTDLTM